MTTSDHFPGGYGDGDTVVVGVKMDSFSRELLTWSLVKVAQPGDLVIALHVLSPNEIFDQDGKSSLLSMVKAFDSVLGVYEGFCNLKQVDLKLKICRGSSVRKIIVREANSCAASKVIVGASAKNHTIRSSTSLAKYCAKKLPKDCSVLAVRNGKVVFQREATALKVKDPKCGATDRQLNDILEGLQRSSTIDSVLDNKNSYTLPKGEGDQTTSDGLQQLVLKGNTLQSESATKQKCSICSCAISSNTSVPRTNMTKEPDDNNQQNNSKALVPFQKLEGASTSISLLVKELPEVRPGWPLLRHTLLSAREGSPSSNSRDISVVQWATLLPSRPFLSSISSSTTKQNCEGKKDDSQSHDQEVQNNAMVPISSEILSHKTSVNVDSKSELRELEGFHERYASTCRLFKYQELQSMTSNFTPDNLIGKGGSSQVYRGSLPDGKELAIKILKPSEDALQEFMMEIEIITSLHHKNIISLFGFCFEDCNLLLVYDLLSRGSLEENLHGARKDPVAFGWNERFKVALGVAEALYYLHNHNNRPIIHRDVKSSNILLSEDFEPQLSDFGLAKQASVSSRRSITCTDVAGTFGYLAPEYFMYGKVTDKIDVFAFGVVLLELLSGRKPISSELPKGEESLVMWAKPILNGRKVSQLLDPRLNKNYNQDQIERMVLAATLCIRRAPRARPHMSLILNLLQGDPDTLKWARIQVDASDNVDRLDEDDLPRIDLQSHLSLALLDVEDDSLSMDSMQHVSLEEYLRGRWSRSSSFD